jgi:hypothetical protein
MHINKKRSILVATLFACAGMGVFDIIHAMETIIAPYQMTKDQIHSDLLGKVKKLDGYDDIYVGAGYSDAGEQMFFAMEKLDDERARNWKNYANILYRTGGIIDQLNGLTSDCNDKNMRKEFTEKGDFYRIGVMDLLCFAQEKFWKLFGASGVRSGINGFNEILNRHPRVLYIAYASPEPITGSFASKAEKKDTYSILEKFDHMYSNIIISCGVDMQLGHPIKRTEHRGIFKNPFYDIKGTYKNTGLLLHAWAGTVENQIFKKIYAYLFPTLPAAHLLHRMVKPGDMYIGIDTQPYPYKDEELQKKFPSIEQELISMYTSFSPEYYEVLHIFNLNLLSHYYTESSQEK